MSNLSPSTVAINTIAHCLASAVDAAADLDVTLSEDLRSLLRIASREVDRIRNANRKAASAAKRAAASQSEMKAPPKPKRTRKADDSTTKPRSRRRKTETANGATAH